MADLTTTGTNKNMQY